MSDSSKVAGYRRAVTTTGILVPDRVADEVEGAFVAEVVAHAAEATAAAEARAQVREAAMEAASEARTVREAAAADTRSKIAALVAEDADEEAPALPFSDGKYQVYSAQELPRFAERIRGITDTDVEKVFVSYRKKMAAAGPYRKLAHANMRRLDELINAQPNYRLAIEHVKNKLIAADIAGIPPRISPIILYGPPGVGKSHFARELAAALCAPMHKIQFDSPVTGAVLTGSDRQWSNTKVGLVFESIVLGTYANPIFVLDELDKASSFRGCDAVAPLHTLLEPSTAPAFRDISTEIIFDTSLIFWIATANYPLAVPPTVRSRFTEFFISTPRPEEAIAITGSVASSVIQESAPQYFAPVNRRIVVALAHLTPREASKAIGDAISRAVAGGRRAISLDDFSADVLGEDEPPSADRLH